MLISYLLLLCSCSEQKETSLKLLQVDYIGHIPHLMVKQQIDSVFEVIEYGKMNTLEKGDTLNYFISNGENIIRQRFKSFMCCTNTMGFDSLGLYYQYDKFTDYLEVFDYERIRVDDSIFETKTSNFGWSIIYKYHIVNGKIESRIGVLDEGQLMDHPDFLDETEYRYSENDLLLKTIRTTVDHPEGAFEYNKTSRTYSWSKDILEHVKTEQYHKPDVVKPIYTTSIYMDSVGFPKQYILEETQDTLVKTAIVKYARQYSN